MIITREGAHRGLRKGREFISFISAVRLFVLSDTSLYDKCLGSLRSQDVNGSLKN